VGLLDPRFPIAVLAGEPPEAEVLVVPGEALAREHVEAERPRDQLVVRSLGTAVEDRRPEPDILRLPEQAVQVFALGHVAGLVPLAMRPFRLDGRGLAAVRPEEERRL